MGMLHVCACASSQAHMYARTHSLFVNTVRRGADKSLAFPIFLFAAHAKEFFLDGLKKLEQRSHKCVELRREYVE
jgi:hypothetical protein